MAVRRNPDMVIPTAVDERLKLWLDPNGTSEAEILDQHAGQYRREYLFLALVKDPLTDHDTIEIVSVRMIKDVADLSCTYRVDLTRFENPETRKLLMELATRVFGAFKRKVA